MNIAFAGFRHSHITGIYKAALRTADVSIIGCYEGEPQARRAMEESLGILFNYQTYKELLADDLGDPEMLGGWHRIDHKKKVGDK